MKKATEQQLAAVVSLCPRTTLTNDVSAVGDEVSESCVQYEDWDREHPGKPHPRPTRHLSIALDQPLRVELRNDVPPGELTVSTSV